MSDMGDIYQALMLGGTLGLIGQGARAAVGLKKMNDTASDMNLDWNDVFVASRLIVSLAIGFLAGVVATLTIGIDSLISISKSDLHVLFGTMAAGYAGTDTIEAFVTRIASPPATPAAPAPQAPGQQGNFIIDARDWAGVLPPTAAAALMSSSELKRDMAEAQKYLKAIQDAAHECALAPSLICAIGSRESNWGQGSDMHPKGPAGTGDWARRDPARWGYPMPPDGLGWGRGLMQVDYAQSDFGKTGDWQDPAANVMFGAKELADNIAYFKAHPHAGVDPVRAATAAYNCGRGNVNRAITHDLDIDVYTTGHDYSRDVTTRAAWFKANGFDDLPPAT